MCIYLSIYLSIYLPIYSCIGFGPAGDPRGAGIGTPQAIQLVWSCHREVIADHGTVAEDWRTPSAS